MPEMEINMNEKQNDGIFVRALSHARGRIDATRESLRHFQSLNTRERTMIVKDIILDRAMLIIILFAIVFIAIREPRFLSVASIVNIISLTAAKLPIALGIGGAIVLTGTDISAGRAVGLTACITASLLQMTGYANKMFAGLPTMPIFVVLLAAIAVGGIIGLINGFFVAKFKLHPFIVTLSTQLVIFGTVLLYLQIGGNGGQTLSGLDPKFLEFVSGPLFRISGIAVPRYVLYSLLITAIMWVVWNKTVFGKNMFAVGSNEEAARVSGVNVFRTIVGVFILAGMLYGFTGFIESARIGSSASYTGLNYESDAIAACVIGGVSFVGGTGKIGGIVVPLENPETV